MPLFRGSSLNSNWSLFSTKAAADRHRKNAQQPSQGVAPRRRIERPTCPLGGRNRTKNRSAATVTCHLHQWFTVSLRPALFRCILTSALTLHLRTKGQRAEDHQGSGREFEGEGQA